MKTTLESLATGATTGTVTPAQAERLQVLALVEQFEGMLLTEMLRDIRAGDEEDGGFGLGSSTMTDVMQGEFGLALSRAGGLGLGGMLARALDRGHGIEGGQSPFKPGPDWGLSPAVPSAALPSPGFDRAAEHRPMAPSDPVDVVGGGVPVTSEFGWRRDPFTGQTRFHRGVDLAMAYGSEVRSFGPGVVASAGDRQGYGLTVVVDHGDGRETLYAHLSSIDVSPGQSVEAGQRLARSGNSGRATGAHLHFEAREFGRAVDVERLAAARSGRPADTGVGVPDE
jgi:murein DD-endopeptidase MepM/ murein hydrolase activator NlpD